VIFHLHISIPYYAPAFIVRIGVWFLLRHRKKRYGMEFRRIKLSCGRNEPQNRYAIIDPEDYCKLAKEDWQFYQSRRDNFYAVRIGIGKIIYMHREITNAPAGKVVHHKDSNGINNTKENLQIITLAENSRCSRKTKKLTTSKYKGVAFITSRKKWQSRIIYNGKNIFLGYYKNEDDAARAYDEAAKKHHGEFAVLNFEQETADMPKYPIP
jgi:hypothetical protein